jgi:hypothetical protein
MIFSRFVMNPDLNSEKNMGGGVSWDLGIIGKNSILPQAVSVGNAG